MGVIVASVERKRALARERARRYRARHPDRCKESDRKWRDANPEAIAARSKRYQDANREKIRSDAAVWREKNPDYQAVWYQENRQEIDQRAAVWRAENRDRWNLYAHKRRVMTVSGEVSASRPADLMRLQRGKCAVCRNDLAVVGYQIDHIVPMARGGRHEDANLQLLCPPCNARKWCKDPIAFMQSRGFLL